MYPQHCPNIFQDSIPLLSGIVPCIIPIIPCIIPDQMSIIIPLYHCVSSHQKCPIIIPLYHYYPHHCPIIYPIIPLLSRPSTRPHYHGYHYYPHSIVPFIMHIIPLDVPMDCQLVSTSHYFIGIFIPIIRTPVIIQLILWPI